MRAGIGKSEGGINVCFKFGMGCLSEYPMIHLKLNVDEEVN